MSLWRERHGRTGPGDVSRNVRDRRGVVRLCLFTSAIDSKGNRTRRNRITDTNVMYAYVV